MGIDQVVLAARGQRVHEPVGGGDGDVEVGDAAVQLAVDELEDVRVVDLQDPHVGAPPGPALLDGLGRAVEDLEERDRPGGAPTGRGDEVVLGTQSREREAGPAARLVDDGVEDLLHRVAHREHVARRVLEAVALARVHERRRVREVVPVDHDVVERGRDLSDGGVAPPVPGFARRDRQRDPPAHLLRGLDDLASLPHEVALPEHPQSWLSPLADFRWAGLRQHFLTSSPSLPSAMTLPHRITISCGASESCTLNLGAVKKKGVHKASTIYPPRLCEALGGRRATRGILWAPWRTSA